VSAGAAFALGLGLTVALLAGAVATGRAARRKPHLAFVASAVAALVVTVVLAERYGSTLDLEAAEPWTTVHLTLAKIVSVAFLLPIGLGFLTLRNPARRALHGKLAWGVLALVALTFVTGAGMLLNAEPRAPGPAEERTGSPSSTVEAAEGPFAPSPPGEASGPGLPD
jgi:hypothetical protein